jgi:SPP1 family predicted phage head-tail adaptor
MDGAVMRSGLRRYRLEILEQGTPARGELGSEIVTWNSAGFVWCEVAPLSGRERMHAEQAKSDTTVIIRVPWVDGRRLTPKHRLKDPQTGTLYEINEALDVNGRRRDMEIRCRYPT